MNVKRAIWLCLAVSALTCLCIPLLPGKHIHLMVLGGASFLLGTSLFVIEKVMKRQDPYSLTALRELEDRDAIRRAEEEHDLTLDADTYCQSCGSSYGSEFKVCPNCHVRR